MLVYDPKWDAWKDQKDTYEFHEYAEVFPLLSADSEEFQQLANDILQHGMRIPIVIYQQQILEGRNRYRVYLSHPEIELNYEDFKGNDEEALDLVISHNVHRRHLDETGRAMSAARLSRVDSKYLKKQKSDKAAAEIFNIGFRSVERAIAILDCKRPNLIDAVNSGILKLGAADEIRLLPIEIIQQILDSDKPEQIAKEHARSLKHREKQTAFSRATIAENRKHQDKGEDLTYGILYIDPPWEYVVRSEAGKDKSAENHYPVMSDDDIRGIELPAAENCVCFLWTTVAKLSAAIEILDGWGFEYSSAYFWNKMNPGTGYWSRNTIEVLLVGRKGSKTHGPELGEQLDQLTTSTKGEHSTKPEVFAEAITKMYPDVPKLEMFARRTNHEGNYWYYWGNEVGKEISVESNVPAKAKRNGKNGKGNGKKKEVSESTPVEQQGTVDSENANDRAD